MPCSLSTKTQPDSRAPRPAMTTKISPGNALLVLIFHLRACAWFGVVAPWRNLPLWRRTTRAVGELELFISIDKRIRRRRHGGAGKIGAT